jgi:hypothetical protein
MTLECLVWEKNRIEILETPLENSYHKKYTLFHLVDVEID